MLDDLYAMKLLEINQNNPRQPIFSYPSIKDGSANFGSYELIQMDTEESIHLFINQEKENINTIVIVGAWRGDEVVSFLKYTNANIFCFEPNPDNFSYLKKRFENNPRVICFPYACSDKDGTMQLNEGNITGNDSLLPIVNSDRLKLKKKHLVQIVRLDSIVELREQKIDLLWMDVQGYELDVLRGSTKLLKNCKAIFSEVYENNPDYINAATYDQVTTHLLDNDFILASEGVSKSEVGMLGGNALFVHKSISLNTHIFGSFKIRVENKLNNEKIKRGVFTNKISRNLIKLIPTSIKISIKRLFKI
jgi:FkbM family methyltransferase